MTRGEIPEKARAMTTPMTLPRSVKADSGFDYAIVGIVGLPARYGGFETLADHLVRRLGDSRRILVYCSGKPPASLPLEYHGATLEYLPWDANGWQSMVYDGLAMLKSARRCHTVLVLGVSGCLFLPLIRLLSPRARIVTNIDGIEWKRQKWGRVARLVLRLSESVAIRLSHVVIADNRGIQDYVAEEYGRSSALIPYGGDNIGQEQPSQSALAARSTRFEPGWYFLTVCRIEPENHIAEILQAFTQVPHRPLVMVGNWGVSAYGSELRARFAAVPNIELLDPIYDIQRLTRLRSEALAYVHGHSAGGTNPSLVEAMHAGLAVLARDVVYNRHTMANLGWYWQSPEELARLLAQVDPDEIASVAAQLRQYAHEHYTWEAVSRAYANVLDPVGTSASSEQGM